MATIVEINIRGTDGDYSDIRAAIAAERTDLVSGDLIHKYIIHDDWVGGLNFSTSSSYLDFNGYNTSETNNVIITCPDADKATGVTGVGVKLWKSGTGYWIAARNQWVTFLGLEITAPNANSGIAGAAGNVRMVDCYYHDAANVFSSVINSIIVGISSHIGDYGKNVTRIGGGSYSGDVHFHTALTNNCVSFRYAKRKQYNSYLSPTAGSDYNAINDIGDGQLAPGVNNFTVTENDFVDYVGGNYNIAPDSPLFTAGLGGTPIGAVLASANPSNDISAVLSLSNQTTITIKAQKLSVASIAINNSAASSLKANKTAKASLSNNALSTTTLKTSKQVNAKVSIDVVNTVKIKVFKQAYGALTLTNLATITLYGEKVVADTRSAVLSLSNQSIVTIKAHKLAQAKVSLLANSSISIFSQKVAVSPLSITNVVTVTINAEKVTIDSRSAVLSLTNQTTVTIKAQKLTNASLHLQNYATTKITKYSDSYIPVVRRLCIQGQIISLTIPANINNKLIIKGCF